MADQINRDRQNAKPVRVIEDDRLFIDDIDANNQIIGKRENTTVAEGDAKWSLKKVVTSGTVTKTLYAEGDQFDIYNKTWTGRTGYTYS